MDRGHLLPHGGETSEARSLGKKGPQIEMGGPLQFQPIPLQIALQSR
jgi:hypothetical protein